MDIHKFLEGIYKELKKLFNSEETKEIKEVRLEKGKNSKFPNFLIICLSAILLGILAMIGSDYFKSASTAKITNEDKPIVSSVRSNMSESEIAAENKLKSVLQDIDGVGRVNVMLTFDGSEEQIPAVNINNSTNNTKEKDNAGGTRETTQKNDGSTIVITNDGMKNQPLIVKTANPKVIGVVVVAEGAKERAIELKIIKAVTGLYNVATDKVSVFPMKK
ncbi:stage III sporulation protein AG [Clostridium swellfunianum]|uniref:stage III sporulation protein AG n=1 Tax=Clostridium swellfunianum TaxID=1367462 RepID=UPI00202E75E7|nr:stage III sporulation protein AG [Clostridium swellfunianum]MCM0650373.1 stage III sporulation protein AG [Clostridium swellfunianum]